MIEQSSKCDGNGKNQEPEKKKSNKGMLILCIILSVLVLGGGGYFVYTKFLKNGKSGKASEDTPKETYYTFIPSVSVRSSKDTDRNDNIYCKLSYGEKVPTYSHGSQWSKVMVDAIDPDDPPIKGYIPSKYLVKKKDLVLLNSIFGDSESKAIIETYRCRKAILDYFKEHNYIGKMSSEDRKKYSYPEPASDNQWQIFCQPKNSSTNTVLFKTVLYNDAKYKDFSVIIKNIRTGERKFLCFAFEEDETPHLAVEQPAPKHGNIRNVLLKTVNGERYVVVEYT